MLRLSIIAISAIAFSTVAVAQDAKPPVAPDKKICRREVSTGSVMAKRTCRTKAEWDAITSQGARARDLMLDQSRSQSHTQLSR